MKIITDTLKQFGCAHIHCSDLVMAEMLEVSPFDNTGHVSAAFFMHRFNTVRANAETGDNQFEILLKSGAKLKIGGGKNRFYVFAYASDAADGYAGLEELRVLYSLRSAKKATIKLYRMLGHVKSPDFSANVKFR